MIVAARATNDPTDFEQLIPMHHEVQSQLGKGPGELLADRGYADLGDIKQIQTETHTSCYIPENNAPVANRNVQFAYEPGADQYRCSAGRILAPKSKGRYRKDKDAYLDTIVVPTARDALCRPTAPARPMACASSPSSTGPPGG